jgi:hypothetical protein
MKYLEKNPKLHMNSGNLRFLKKFKINFQFSDEFNIKFDTFFHGLLTKRDKLADHFVKTSKT